MTTKESIRKTWFRETQKSMSEPKDLLTNKGPQNYCILFRKPRLVKRPRRSSLSGRKKEPSRPAASPRDQRFFCGVLFTPGTPNVLATMAIGFLPFNAVSNFYGCIGGYGDVVAYGNFVVCSMLNNREHNLFARYCLIFNERRACCGGLSLGQQAVRSFVGQLLFCVCYTIKVFVLTLIVLKNLAEVTWGIQ